METEGQDGLGCGSPSLGRALAGGTLVPAQLWLLQEPSLGCGLLLATCRKWEEMRDPSSE